MAKRAVSLIMLVLFVSGMFFIFYSEYGNITGRVSDSDYSFDVIVNIPEKTDILKGESLELPASVINLNAGVLKGCMFDFESDFPGTISTEQKEIIYSLEKQNYNFDINAVSTAFLGSYLVHYTFSCESGLENGIFYINLLDSKSESGLIGSNKKMESRITGFSVFDKSTKITSLFVVLISLIVIFIALKSIIKRENAHNYFSSRKFIKLNLEDSQGNL